ncbi:Small basic protein [Salinibacillus kushneri]|uniref:Small basic protein n=1 Tax=Salinibacillus kushneri TaxID=237682 RepID=A0A1I0HMT1_9BACI|nr:small basic family protein [Salinibacillus kushneri]SET85287.1 Small basic protein [Salinibacillus kushneri]
MWLTILFLIIGVALGLLTDIRIPELYADYLAVAVLAAFDTLIGGIRSHLEEQFDEQVFVTGFFTNICLAGLLVFVGVQLGIDLYLAAIFAFGIRLFQNIAIIRRILLEKVRYARMKKNSKK